MPRPDVAPQRIYLGIDPGASGGLAEIGVAQRQYCKVVAMPGTERDIWEWIEERMVGVAVIEKVHAMPGNGVSGMFKFGMGYGGLRMALIAAGIPFEEVTSQAWLRALGIPFRKPHTKVRQVEIKKGKNKGKLREERYGGETDTEFKNRLKAKAQQLFPGIQVTLKTADALLIALYCRRKHEGTL